MTYGGIDLYIGLIIEDMEIIDLFKKGYTAYMKVKCLKCGKERNVRAEAITCRHNSFKHDICDKNYNNRISIYDNYKINDVIGDMIITGYSKDCNNTIMVNCRCLKCGKERSIRAQSIKITPGTVTHDSCIRGLGKQNERMYNIWKGINQRIYNKNCKEYPNYGGRGLITEYDRFEDFYNDLGDEYYKHVEQYGEKNTTIDRINNSLGYVKGNLRWATYEQQAKNTRNNIIFIAFDKENSQTYISNNVTKFAKHHGLQPSCISNCLHGIRQYTGTFVFEFFCPPFIPAYAFNNPNVIKEFYY